MGALLCVEVDQAALIRSPESAFPETCSVPDGWCSRANARLLSAMSACVCAQAIQPSANPMVMWSWTASLKENIVTMYHTILASGADVKTFLLPNTLCYNIRMSDINAKASLHGRTVTATLTLGSANLTLTYARDDEQAVDDMTELIESAEEAFTTVLEALVKKAQEGKP